jgi:hypothetical protein
LNINNVEVEDEVDKIMEEFHNQAKQRDYYSLLNLDKNVKFD